jgi:hypothetical protein
MITRDQLTDAFVAEWEKYKGYKWKHMTDNDKDEFYVRLGFASCALKEAGLIESVQR